MNLFSVVNHISQLELKNIDLFIKEMKSNVRREKYKKVLEEIAIVEEKNTTILKKWELLNIKVETLFKVFYKYFYQNDLILGKEYKNVDSLMNLIDQNIEKYLEDLYLNERNFEENEIWYQLELIFTSYVTQMYNCALFSKREKKSSDCCAFLGIAEKLIKTFGEKTKNNKFLYFSAQVYLFISSLLISDEDYTTAMNYQNKCLVICFRLISYMNPNQDYLNLLNLKKSNRNYVEKAIVCICTAFYHRGFCEETLGNLMRSVESYSQAQWFSNKFLIDILPEFVFFLNDVNNRIARDIKKSRNKNQGSTKKFSLKKEIKKEKINFEKINEIEVLKLEYRDTISKIEKLKFPEFDEDNHDNQNVQRILYTIRMTNFLMSDEFKSLVTDLEKVNIHKMDKETINKIRKKLVEVHAKESFEKYCIKMSKPENFEGRNNSKRNNSGVMRLTQKSIIGLKRQSSLPGFSNSVQTNKLGSLNLYMKNKIPHTDLSLVKSILNNQSKTQTFTINRTFEEETQIKSTDRKEVIQTEISTGGRNDILEYDLILPNNAINYVKEASTTKCLTEETFNDKIPMTAKNSVSGQNKTSNYLEAYYNKNKLQKFNYNKFIFNNTFQDKIKSLNSNFNKELDFQKRLLKLKKNEKIFVDQIDFKKKSQEYKIKFMKKIQEDKIKFIKKSQIKHKDSDNLAKFSRINKQINKIEQVAMKSLDFKPLSDLRKVQIENQKVFIKENFLKQRYEKENKIEIDEVLIETQQKIFNLDKEIGRMEKVEKQNLKEIHPILYKEKLPTPRKLINENKKTYNRHFSKLNSYMSIKTSMAHQSKEDVIRLYTECLNER